MLALMLSSCLTRSGISLATSRLGRGRVYRKTTLQSTLHVNVDGF